MSALLGMDEEEPAAATAASYAFAAPPGFTMPDDVQEGDAFDVVAKVRLEGGQLVFDQINGMELGGETTETEEVVEQEEPEEELDLMSAAKQSGY